MTGMHDTLASFRSVTTAHLPGTVPRRSQASAHAHTTIPPTIGKRCSMPGKG
jgi:hypothetical protein